MNNLIVMVGVVGSGKSTFALNYQKNMQDRNDGDTVIISSDAIRKELLGDENDQSNNQLIFHTVHKRIKENLIKRNVIVDATNISIKNRRGILNTVDKIECKKTAIVMTTPIPFCHKWNSSRERVVPDHVIDMQVKRFQIPFYEEGWDNIAFSGWSGVNFGDFKKGWDLDTDPIFNRMRGFDQKNSHHAYTLEKHCERLAEEVAKVYPDNLPMIRAATIHDIGKLYTGEPKEDGSGNWSYKGHMNWGAYTLLQNIDILGFNDFQDILDCIFFVNYHMEPFFWLSNGKDGSQYIKYETEKKMRRFYGDTKFNQLLFFNECDRIASGTERGEIKFRLQGPPQFKPKSKDKDKKKDKFKNKK